MDNLFTIKDIVGPIETLPQAPLWPWIVGVVIIFVAYKFLRKTKPDIIPEPLPAKLSPLKVALRELEALLTEKLIEEGSTKLFFTKLNMILRTFLKATYKRENCEITTHIRTKEIPTPETLLMEPGCPHPGESSNLLKTDISSQTTSELLHSNSIREKMSDDCRRQFSVFLNECDLFKFADIKARDEISSNAHKACRNLIVAIARERGES